MSNSTTPTLKFGSRGSDLARWQTTFVAKNLTAIFPNLQTTTIIFTTTGDRELSKPLPQIGGKGLFTAELEAALLQKEIDLAVHSLKDLPTENPPGLTIGAILSRENPADVLISRQNYTLATLPNGATIGTSSLRRAAQLLAYRSDFKIVSLRGNVDTRLKKAFNPDGPYDAIILAAAGLHRMNLQDHIDQYLPFEVMLPAPGQGAVAVQCRADDTVTQQKLSQLNHSPTQQAVRAERAFLSGLGGGCSVPVGALGLIEDNQLMLHGLVADPQGKPCLRLQIQGPVTEAEALGQALANQALAQGAAGLLEKGHEPATM